MEFIEGKWYTTNETFHRKAIRYQHGGLEYSECIGSKYEFKPGFCNWEEHRFKLSDMKVVATFLPKGHPDLLIETSLLFPI